MNSREKSTLTNMNKEEEFSDAIRKLTLNESLTDSEANYILSAALIFLKEHVKEKSNKAYFEFGYYIVLKYSIIHEDYRPIYDVALNYGFYPIVKFIHENSLLSFISVLNSIYEISMDQYSTEGYTETFNQYNSRNNILDSMHNEISYVAPTSFGKSRIIFEHLSKNLNYSKIAIIVPTKSLISQTTKEVRKRRLNKKVISHDGMYDNDESFIAILTQERALRLIQKNNISFDLMYIDEAHNLFEKGDRNILLQRLIRMNYTRNNDHKVLYLSPLISDSENLKFIDSQVIDEQRIDFNIKEPEIYQLNENKEVLKYNRFVNDFYKIGKETSIFSHIIKYAGSKSFIYLRAPRKIEEFSKELIKYLPKVNITEEMQEVLNIIDRYVHEDFYVKEFFKYGVVYLHGKVPDHIKDYLEHKFKVLSELKYLVANSVILEGVNLPIDTLFILNTYGLNEKKLTNLIGRVNRLDYVFEKNTGDLNKLLPNIHFIDSNYNSQNIRTINKIRSLRSRYFTDIIENPTLLNFDLEKLKIKYDDKEKKSREFEGIVKNENLLFDTNKNSLDEFKSKLIFNGIHNIISLNDYTINILKTRISEYQTLTSFKEINIIEKIYLVFIKDLEDRIVDYEFKRLQNDKARDFYKGFIKWRKSSLKNQIKSQMSYFNKRISENDAIYYMGESYGELSLSSEDYKTSTKDMYINLESKTEVELINLAIVKIKLEEDFIGFKIRKFIEMLHELKVVSDEEYNITVYGTNNQNKINLLKLGFNSTVLSKLEEDGQIDNFYLDCYYNLRYNQKFEEYRESLDDYFSYEIDKIT